MQVGYQAFFPTGFRMLWPRPTCRYSAAEVAVAAMCSLHTRPHLMMKAMLQGMAASCGLVAHQPGGAARPPTSAPALAHFLFVLGHCALQQLVGRLGWLGVYEWLVQLVVGVNLIKA